MEEIIKTEKEYLVNVLHKKLIDSEERDDRTRVVYNGKRVRGYRVLAMKYWPEEFEKAEKEGYVLHVHHINFDRTDNRVCNLIPLTPEEHKFGKNNIHQLFDIKCSCKGKYNPMFGKCGKDNPNYGSKRTIQQKDNMSKAQQGKTISKQTRDKMRESHKNPSDDTIQKLSAVSSGRKWMTNGNDEMRVFPPWDKDMLIFGWKYGRLKRG